MFFLPLTTHTSQFTTAFSSDSLSHFLLSLEYKINYSIFLLSRASWPMLLSFQKMSCSIHARLKPLHYTWAGQIKIVKPQQCCLKVCNHNFNWIVNIYWLWFKWFVAGLSLQINKFSSNCFMNYFPITLKTSFSIILNHRYDSNYFTHLCTCYNM